MTTMKTKMLQPSIFLVLSIIAGVFCTITEVSTPEDVYQSTTDNAIDMTNDKCPRKDTSKPVDCMDLFRMGHKENGTYYIWPMSRIKYNKPLLVFCDMETDGGGWTVIQRRGKFNRSDEFFHKDWKAYKEGFGHINKDFWLGNDDIFVLTNQKPYAARFDMSNFRHETSFAVYDEFWIEDESNKYTLHISGSKGKAGDSMTESHNNRKFSTYDQDNDDVENVHCGEHYKSGWWFQNTQECYTANLNGVYYNENGKGGVYWATWNHEILVWTEIKIRPT